MGILSSHLQVRGAIAVTLGAVPGALSRYTFTTWVQSIVGQSLSYGATFLINVTGCFMIAYILTLAIEKIKAISPELRLLLATGFCGAFTTFSTYGLDTKLLLDQDKPILALLYCLGSMIVGMGAVKIGILLARSHQSPAEKL